MEREDKLRLEAKEEKRLENQKEEKREHARIQKEEELRQIAELRKLELRQEAEQKEQELRQIAENKEQERLQKEKARQEKLLQKEEELSQRAERIEQERLQKKEELRLRAEQKEEELRIRAEKKQEELRLKQELKEAEMIQSRQKEEERYERQIQSHLEIFDRLQNSSLYREEYIKVLRYCEEKVNLLPAFGKTVQAGLITIPCGTVNKHGGQTSPGLISCDVTNESHSQSLLHVVVHDDCMLIQETKAQISIAHSAGLAVTECICVASSEGVNIVVPNKMADISEMADTDKMVDTNSMVDKNKMADDNVIGASLGEDSCQTSHTLDYNQQKISQASLENAPYYCTDIVMNTYMVSAQMQISSGDHSASHIVIDHKSDSSSQGSRNVLCALNGTAECLKNVESSKVINKNSQTCDAMSNHCLDENLLGLSMPRVQLVGVTVKGEVDVGKVPDKSSADAISRSTSGWRDLHTMLTSVKQINHVSAIKYKNVFGKWAPNDFFRCSQLTRWFNR